MSGNALLVSSLLILAVLAVQALFRHTIPARLRYALWLIVAVRLVLPVPFFESEFGMQPASLSAAQSEVAGTHRTEKVVHTGANHQEAARMYTVGEPDGQAEGRAAPQDLLRLVRMGGTAGVLCWFLLVNARFARMLRRRRVPCGSLGTLPVYRVDGLPSPCVCGILRPAIYLNGAVGADQVAHVLAHERAHLRHGDLVWSWVRAVLVAAYWFHPLVWLAAWLSRQDSELAADEAALSGLGDSQRVPYGMTLVRLASGAGKASPTLQLAATLNTSCRCLRERLLRVKTKRRMTVLPAVCAVLVVLFCAGCAMTAQPQEQEAPVEQKNGEFAGTLDNTLAMLLSVEVEDQTITYEQNGTVQTISVAHAELHNRAGERFAITDFEPGDSLQIEASGGGVKTIVRFGHVLRLSETPQQLAEWYALAYLHSAGDMVRDLTPAIYRKNYYHPGMQDYAVSFLTVTEAEVIEVEERGTRACAALTIEVTDTKTPFLRIGSNTIYVPMSKSEGGWYAELPSAVAPPETWYDNAPEIPPRYAQPVWENWVLEGATEEQPVWVRTDPVCNGQDAFLPVQGAEEGTSQQPAQRVWAGGEVVRFMGQTDQAPYTVMGDATTPSLAANTLVLRLSDALKNGYAHEMLPGDAALFAGVTAAQVEFGMLSVQDGTASCTITMIPAESAGAFRAGERTTLQLSMENAGSGWRVVRLDPAG